MSDDFYKILGVSRDATAEDIKRQYRVLAKDTHPDLNPGDKEAEARFKKISEAYDVLSDPEKKFSYDNPNPFETGFGNFSFSPFGAHSFFSQFNFSAERPPAPPIPPHGSQRGRTHEIELVVTPFDILLESEISFEYMRLMPCPACNGHGADLKHCPSCEGYGIQREVKTGGHQRVVRDIPCNDCGQTGIMKENACEACQGTGLALKPFPMKMKLGSTYVNGPVGVNEAGHYGPFGGPPGTLILHIKVTYPLSTEIRDEAKNKLKEVYEEIYKKDGV